MTIDARWLAEVGGSFCGFLGALLMAWDFIISKNRAVELSLPRYVSSIDEENRKLPEVKYRLKQSRNVKIGVVLLTIGFLLQIIGNLLP
jgi:hypothetical protein